MVFLKSGFSIRKNRFVFIVLLALVSVFSYLYSINLDSTDSLAKHFYETIRKNVTWIISKENETWRKHLRRVTEKRSDPAYEILDNNTILPASARIKAKLIFKNKPLVMWSNEEHMTPIKCVMDLITPFGVNVLNYNLDRYRCHLQDCKAREKLKVLNVDNILDAGPPLDKQFYEAYKNDSVMESVDVVYCGHPAYICEFFMPFNKSVMIVPSLRYEMGRFSADKWKLLNENLKKFASKPWNIIGANNIYDAKYLQHYTGLETHLIPSFCDYTEAEYTNERKEFVVFRRNAIEFQNYFFDIFKTECIKVNCSSKVVPLSAYTYRDLAKYRAVIHVPYQVSIMSFYELYRMNIPSFFPSQSLLAKWHTDHFLMSYKSMDGIWNRHRVNGSIIPPHPSQKGVPDPKNDYDYDAIFYWFQFVDFYHVMPHTIIYDSISHLISMLDNLEDNFLMSISRKMQEFNIEYKKDLLNKWRDILLGYAKNSPNYPN